MARGNAETERHLVQLAEPRASDVVLVLGHGPGIGLLEAAARSRNVIGVDPSELMGEVARRCCADLIGQGRVRLEPGDAAGTGEPDASVDVVLAVNNVQLWPDRPAGFTELHRVLRPGGRMLLSAHRRWLPVDVAALAAEIVEAGFTGVDTWTWEPPGRGGRTAVQLRAQRPAA